ncbi:MAG TPA: adenylate/guanylate cyclase domain-containing protein [bacterium]|nr:adenylate/guanylate cyclase domain-containing protein [bacterium]
MKKIPIVPAVFCLLAVLPLAFLSMRTSGILKRVLQEKVVNDPATGLIQGSAVVSSELDRASKQLLLDAWKFSQRDGLKKALYFTYPNAVSSAIRPICEAGLAEKSFPFLAIVGKDGKILFDNLSIPKPTPDPLPTASSKMRSHHPSKTPTPTYASASDWPAMDQALKGARASGVLTVLDRSFLACLFPIENRGKVLGVLVAGVPLDADWLSSLQKKASLPLALDTKQGVLPSWPDRGPSRTETASLDGVSGSSKPQTVTLDQKAYLAGSQTLFDPSGKRTAFLLALSPIQKDWIVTRDPRKEIVRSAFWAGTVFFILALAFGAFYLFQYRKLMDFVQGLSGGPGRAPAPALAFPEWSSLQGVLEELRERNLEKERVSLILGKVVDPIAAQKILSDRDYFSLRGEKRECTLLFADLKGFHALTENLKPEDLVESLNRYFTLINEIVFKHEGMLDRFMGDSLLAIWGAPFTHEDKEKRAAQAALEIQEALKEFNLDRIKKGAPPFTVGIALHTGPVVAGNLGSDKHFDYSILGEPLSIVTRLCALTAPGQTAVTQETFERLGAGAKGEPLSPIALRDSPETLKTFSLRSLS